MNRKPKGRILLAALSILLLLAGCNGQDPDERTAGADAFAPLVQGETAVELEHSEMVFDLPALAEAEDPMQPGGTYTLDLTLQNPSEETAEVQMALPLAGADAVSAERFMVQADSQPVTAVLHQTVLPRETLLNADQAKELLEQESLRDAPWSGELTVTQYTYAIYEYYTLPCFQVETDPTTQRILVPSTTVNAAGERFCQVFREYPSHGEQQEPGESWFTFFVVGQPLDAEPTWRYDAEGDETADGSIALLKTETMTVDEMIHHSQVDRLLSASQLVPGGTGREERTRLYREQLLKMLDQDCYAGVVDLACFNGPVLYWLEYTLSVPAGGELLHTVTGPLCPTVYTGYKPYVYAYSMNIGSLAGWARQGSLTCELHSPDPLVSLYGEEVPPSIASGRWEVTAGDADSYSIYLCSVAQPHLRFKLANFMWVILGVALVLGIFCVVGWYPQWKFRQSYGGEYRGKKGS